MTETGFVIMGLPASGKTTFLAALWHLLESQETNCRLTLDRYEGDFEYLNRIAEAWRTFQRVPRTSQVGDVDISLELIDRVTGAKSTAFFPDLAGETFDAQVEARQCRPELIEAVASDDGILFFISADVKGEGLSIVELNAAIPDLGMDVPSPSADENGPPEPTVEEALDGEAEPGAASETGARLEWQPKMVLAQVRVVQLLSDMLRSPFEPRRRRLAVIVSAWDLTRGSSLSPMQWLSERMPLVAQFLRSNQEAFESRVYGVSAQGVRLDDASAVRDAAKLVPSRRIEIVGDEGSGHDLTVPLVWLMSSR